MSSVVETPPDERVETLVEENTTTATYSQRQLIWRRFKKHRAGVIGGCVVIFPLLMCLSGRISGPTRSGASLLQLRTPARPAHPHLLSRRHPLALCLWHQKIF